MLDPNFPRPQSSLVDGEFKPPSREWYEFWRRFFEAWQDSGIDTALIQSILSRLTELEQNENNFIIQGLLSVTVNGTPQSGMVQITLDNDVELPGNTYYYGTGPTGIKGYFQVADAFTNGPGIDLTTGPDGVTDIAFDADTAPVAALPGATYSTLQKLIDVMWSPGIITGGQVTALNPTTARILAGTAILRIADDNVSELRLCNFAQTDFAVPDIQTTHFYALDYNGGTPIVVQSLTDTWDRDTQIPLGSAFRLDGALNVTPNPYRVGDVITNLIQRADAIGPVLRDNSIGGLQISNTGTRNVAVTTGRLWSRVSDFTVPAKNSAVDSMFSAYFNGTNLTVTPGITQWDNLNFNNMGTGSLQLMGNNKWANLWIFMSFDGTKYGFAYGIAEHNSLGAAATEGIPPYLTQNFFNQALLLGRFIFQKSAATPGLVESAFNTVFGTSAVNNHNDLAGLQGGAIGEYYHLTAAEYATIGSLSNPHPAIMARMNIGM